MTKPKNKFLEWLSNAGQRWAMSTDPAVMQASGYVSKPEGVKHEDSASAQQLRNNLAVLSGTANTVVNMGLAGATPALASEAGAVIGGSAGAGVGAKLDDRLGTTYWSPVLGITGSFIGGGAPYAANKYWNGLKATWNSGKTVRPDYANWGGEFVDRNAVGSIAMPGTKKYALRKTVVDPLEGNLLDRVRAGKQDAIAFMNNPAVLNGALKNMRISKRLGVDIMPSMTSKYIDNPVMVEMKPLPNDVLGRVRLNRDPNLDGPVQIDSRLNRDYTENAAFHEFLHKARFGAADPDFPNMFEPTNKFFRWKLEKLLKPKSELPAELHGIHDDWMEVFVGNEPLVHLAEVGRRMKVSPGQAYPGNEEFLRMINNYIKEDPTKGEKFFQLFRMNKPKRVWEAITGVYEEGGKIKEPIAFMV